MQNQESFKAFNLYCKQKIVFGTKVMNFLNQKDLPNLIGVIFFELGLFIENAVFVLPLSIHYQYTAYGIFTLVFAIVPLIALLNVAMTEPGVLLKGNIEKDEQEEKEKKDKNINRLLEHRYCRTCKIMRPPLSSHCKYCDHCVDGFDHHCFFVANCIGIRNWRAFVFFLIVTWLSSLFLVIQAFILVIEQGSLIYYLWVEMFGYGSIAILIFLFLYIVCGCWKLGNPINIFLICFFIISLLIYSYCAMYLMIDDKDQEKYYQNPQLTIYNLIIYLIVNFYLLPVTFINCYNALLFKTAKQRSAEIESGGMIRRRLPIKDYLKNLVKFITYTVPQSRLGQ